MKYLVIGIALLVGVVIGLFVGIFISMGRMKKTVEEQ